MIDAQEGTDTRDEGLLFLDLVAGFDEFFIEALENRDKDPDKERETL